MGRAVVDLYRESFHRVPERITLDIDDDAVHGGQQLRLFNAHHDEYIDCWEDVEDPRTGNAALHDFHEILAIALCAVLCGSQGSVDLGLFAKSKEPFLRGFLKLENGMPSHDTFSRLYRMLDPEQLRAASSRFMDMNEDQDRSRLGNAPHNLAVLRHMALNIMQKDGEKGSLRRKTKRAGWDEAYLARLLILF